MYINVFSRTFRFRLPITAR